MKNIIVVTDPGKDLDDENTLVLASELSRLGVVNLLAVVAVLAPAKKRALLAKGTLKKVGMGEVPVGIGSDCITKVSANDHEFAGIDYLAAEDEVVNGRELLVNTLTAAEDGSITLLVIAGQTDVAWLFENHAPLAKAKLESVVIMGGVKQENDEVLLNAAGFMEPDTGANNAFDAVAAATAHRIAQELGIKLVILTREAAYACAVPRSHYDDLAATGHAVGVKLRNTQRGLIEALWKRTNLPADDAGREGLPGRCDKTWFINTFAGGKGADRNGQDSIWDLIQSFFLYDPMTLVAALDDKKAEFYEPTIVTVGGVNHEVIGVSKNKRGVKDGTACALYIEEKILAGLSR